MNTLQKIAHFKKQAENAPPITSYADKLKIDILIAILEELKEIQ